MREEPQRPSKDHAFLIYSKLMMIYGVWPLQQDTVFLRTRVVFAACELLLAVVAAIVRFNVDCGSPEELVDTFLLIVCFSSVTVKCVLLYVHRDKLATVVHTALRDWETVDNEKYKLMMIKASKFCDTISKLFFSVAMFSLWSYLVKVLVFDEVYVIDSNNFGIIGNNTSMRLLPKYVLPGACVFDIFGTVMYYFTVVNQAIQMTVSCAINIGGDSFYVAITTHVCEQCEILKLEFEKFGQLSGLQKNREHLTSLILRHQQLMTVAELLEDVYNQIIFTQMFFGVILISFGGFSFLLCLKEGSIVGAMKGLGVIQFMLLQSYIYTFPADNLKNQADGLLRSLYWSQWYNMPAVFLKDMVFMMMRINLPPYYTAGKVFYMTRESFLTVIKTAASYLSVLRIMIK